MEVDGPGRRTTCRLRDYGGSTSVILPHIQRSKGLDSPHRRLMTKQIAKMSRKKLQEKTIRRGGQLLRQQSG